MSAPIRVLCVDDHRLVRDGIALIISSQPDLEVVGFAATSDEAVAQFNRLKPDVTLMDLRLGVTSGLSAIQAIKRGAPDARIIVLTMYASDEDIHQALAAGAMGYLFKSVVEDELVDAIREINSGRRYLPKSVAARLSEHKTGAHLTRREDEILELLGKGMGNRELGQVLGVSEDTIKTHLKSLFRKLEVSDRAEAVREGLRRGFIRSQ